MSTAGAADRIWLDVPFSEKDDARRHGARWDAQARRWYAPRPGIEGLARWAALPEIPEQLPGEDRDFGGGLFVDLVPQSCWFTNVRTCVNQRDWERLRRMVVGRAGSRCETCGSGEDRTRKPRERWLEVHERWAYDYVDKVQSLRRLICLCTDCHTATHFGLAQVQGLADEAYKHLKTVTGMPDSEARVHVSSAFRLWQARSQHRWTLDLSLLAEVGVTVIAPPAADERVEEAAAQLAAARGWNLSDDDAVALAALDFTQIARQSQAIPGETLSVRVRLPSGQEVDLDPHWA